MKPNVQHLQKESLNLDSLNPSVTSNAASYTNSLSSRVNPRTGTLQLAISLPILAGFFGDSITPSIFYQNSSSIPENNILGLPLGWSYPFSFITDNRLYIHGQQSYLIDSEYKSGLKYYNLKNLAYEECITTTFPYDKTETYQSFLRFQNGTTQYFDSNGRLLGIDDRFGNYVLFYYDSTGPVSLCRLDKIVNSYGQEIRFSYLQGAINIIYPKGGSNLINITYLTDSNNSHLIGYIDPLGNKTILENNGGIIRTDLVSEIDYPNGMKTTYEYSTIPYSTSNGTFNLDVVSSVTETYEGQARITSYSYDPYDDGHNYTGNPSYSTNGEADSLLESNDNTYSYSTRVNDGIFATDFTYNFLHLEITKKIFRIDNLTNPICSISNTYQGEDNEGGFPQWNELPPNYQTPIEIFTTIYNESGNERSHKLETDYDVWGNPTEVRYYATNIINNQMLLVRTESTVYDYENSFGLPLQKDTYDYTLNANLPSISRILNTPTEDRKNIGTTIHGCIVNGVFEPNKKKSLTYDSQGRVTYEKLEWANGQVHSLEYTESSASYAVSCPTLTITRANAQNQKSIETIDTATGLVIREIDALGYSRSYTYDNLGRTVSCTNSLGITKKWIYDDHNNKITTSYANGYETYRYFNGFGQTIQSSDNMGNNQSERVLSKKTYNNKGQLITDESILGANSRIIYQYDDQGRVSSATDALGNITKYTYDPVEQTKITYYNNLKFSESSWNLNIDKKEIYSASSQGDKVEASQSYNAYHKVIEQILGNKSIGPWHSSSYEYDADMSVSNINSTGVDNVLSQHQLIRDLFSNPMQEIINLTSPNNSSISKVTGSLYIYNNLNQLIEERNALNQSYYFTYSQVGQQVTYKDYAGTIFTSAYDPDGKISNVSYKDKAGKTHKKIFTYDPVNRNLIFVENLVDNVSEGAIQYKYSLDNKLTSMIYPDGKNIIYKYDNARGVLDQFTDALGQTTQYKYDDYGRLIGGQIVGTNNFVSFAYYTIQESQANSGKLKTVQISNGIQKDYIYNDYGSVETLTITNTTIHSSANIIAKLIYTYDQTTKNIIGIQYSSTISPQDKNLNYSVGYAYNSLNQLVTEILKDSAGKQISSTQYSFDAAGNIVSEHKTNENGQVTSIIYAYDADNKLISVQRTSGTYHLSYDMNGNLIDDGEGSTYVYNEKNQLIGYQNKIKNIQSNYTYYPDEMRASKQVNNSDRVQFYYDGSDIGFLINEVQSNKSVSYLMIGDMRYVRFVNDQKQVMTQCFFDNGKDTIGFLDGSNKIEGTYSYEPYGEQRNESTQTPSFDLSHNPFRYTSEYNDVESDLIYLRARYYNPHLRRFMSRDTTRLVNRYIYADGNPVMNLDPTGLFSWGIFAASLVVGIVASVVTAGAASCLVAGELSVAAALGSGISTGSALAIGGVAGAAGSVASDAVTAGIKGEKFRGERAGIDLASGFAGGFFGVGAGALAGRGISSLTTNLIARGVGSGLGGGLVGSSASYGVSAGISGQSFSAESFGMSIGIGGGLGMLGGGFSVFDLARIPTRANLVTPGDDGVGAVTQFLHPGQRSVGNRTVPQLGDQELDVLANHGARGGKVNIPVIDGMGNNGVSMDATQFAKGALLKQPRLGTRGGALKLAICYAADGGNNSTAQRIADVFNRTTYGTTDTVKLHFWTADNNTWSAFTPRINLFYFNSMRGW
jgi:RHS repeat-associated protein